MICIELVKVGDRLVGRTVSCRWNLMQLGIGTIVYDRNQKAVKVLRRRLEAKGFRLSVVRDGKLALLPSPSESAAFNGVVPKFLADAA